MVRYQLVNRLGRRAASTKKCRDCGALFKAEKVREGCVQRLDSQEEFVIAINILKYWKKEQLGRAYERREAWSAGKQSMGHGVGRSFGCALIGWK